MPLQAPIVSLKKAKLYFSPQTWKVPSLCIASFFWSGPSLATVTEIAGPRFGAKKQLFLQRKRGALCLSILIIATGHGFLEYTFPSFGAQAACCWNSRSSAESRGITGEHRKPSAAAPRASLGRVRSVPFFPRSLTSPAPYIIFMFDVRALARVLCTFCAF